MTSEADLRTAIARAAADVASTVDARAGAAAVRRRVRSKTARRAVTIALTVLAVVTGAGLTILRSDRGSALALATTPSLDLRSARVAAELTISVDWADTHRLLTLQGETIIDFTRRRAAGTLTDQTGAQFRAVTVDTTSCLMYPAAWRQRLRLPTDWVCLEMLPAGRVGPALSPSADRFDDQLRAIDAGYYADVERVGVDQVAGTVATRYRLRVSQDRIERARRAAGTPELYLALTAASEQLDVWLDRDGVVRRTVSTMTEQSKISDTAASERLVETPVEFGVATDSIALPRTFTRLSAADLAWRLRAAADLLPVR
jgi:hypothetical protein